MRKQMFNRTAPGAIRSLGAAFSRPAPMGSCNGRPSLTGPVEKQPTVAYSHIG
jgi:hypothetical protein